MGTMEELVHYRQTVIVIVAIWFKYLQRRFSVTVNPGAFPSRSFVIKQLCYFQEPSDI